MFDQMFPNAGLLGPDEQNAARNNLLFNFGLGLLANQYSPSTGQAIGQAGMQAMNSQNQFVNQALQNKMTKQKLDDAERQRTVLPQLIGKAPEELQYGSTVTEGEGLLGGKISPQQFFAGISGLGGDYTQYGLSGLTKLADASAGRGEYYQFLPTAEGYMVGDARRGTINAPGNKVIPAQFDPKLQGRISREKEFGQVEGNVDATSTVKKPRQAKDTLSLLDEADKLIDSSTGSYVGAGVDALARTVGKSTEGANAAAELKVVQAALMTNMPRMEGPQSDRDVELYKQAAGDIGDPTMPNDRKKAALKTIRKINDTYASRANSVAKPKPSGNTVKWGDLK